MNKCIIQNITIYILLCMFLLLQKPQQLYDTNGKVKSWNYFNDKIKNGYNDIEELICLPVIFIIFSIVSFLISQSIKDN